MVDTGAVAADRREVALVLEALGSKLGDEPLERLGGVGLMGRVFRSQTATGDWVAVKLPSSDPQNHSVALGFGYYRREAIFYRRFCDQLTGLVPGCIGVVDQADGSVALVLEDRTDLATADQLDGASASEAHAAVGSLALLHGLTWEHPSLAGSGLPSPLDAEILGFGSLFHLTWPGFEAAFPDLVDAEIAAKAHRMIDGYEDACTQLAQPPNSLVHGDFRLDNLLFTSDSEPTRALTLDWQLASRGSGAYDLCRFLVGSLSGPTLADELIDVYLAGLRGSGVLDYDRARLDTDLAAALVLYLPIPVTVAVGVASLDERAQRLKRTLAERLCAAIRRQDLP
jgi:hypothetical protein